MSALAIAFCTPPRFHEPAHDRIHLRHLTARRGNGALIGLDIGTTGARAIAINLDGDKLASASAGYPLSTPRPGWTEQDPEMWWSAGQAVVAEVSAVLSEKSLALGLTGQMHGSVFLDSADKVIRPALLWNDQRTARQCERITELVGAETLLRTTGNVAITGFQAPKVLFANYVRRGGHLGIHWRSRSEVRSTGQDREAPPGSAFRPS